MPRKRQSTKSRIVKSAWNLFYKNGYDDTTVEDIITASKTSKGTFYHYFKSKEGLLNTLSYLFDEKYEELYNVVDPNMIETSIDVSLVAYLYSAQLVTKDKRSLSDHKRFYYVWLSEIIQNALDSGEFAPTSSAKDLMDIYAMFERALLYDWSLVKGKFSLTEKSDALLPHVLDTFVNGL